MLAFFFSFLKNEDWIEFDYIVFELNGFLVKTQ